MASRGPHWVVWRYELARRDSTAARYRVRSRHIRPYASLILFFFNDTAPTEIYTLPLHDALPIFPAVVTPVGAQGLPGIEAVAAIETNPAQDRKSTRLNSSHEWISYAVFCLE